jgi:hypothetical protein
VIADVVHHVGIASRFDHMTTKLKRGPLKGKTVSYASTDRIDELRRVADDFMLEVFDLLPGEYLITDESSLRDFTDYGISETGSIWTNITKIYAISHADIPSERLADIFAEIQARTNLQ